MVLVSAPPALELDALTLYHAIDPQLCSAPILVFYGPFAATNTNSSSSYIQAHIFTPAGFQSYPRLAVSPISPLYAAVSCLTRDEQGDEVRRGLAFILYKFFSELPEATKDVWTQQSLSSNRSSSRAANFSDMHAANLASLMTRSDNTNDVIKSISTAIPTQSLSHLDIDIVLPPGSIHNVTERRESYNDDGGESEATTRKYGSYAPLLDLLGEPAFLPTSNIRRARSKATGINRTTKFSRVQKETLRREMCELIDTEESYVSKLYDLVHSVAADFREKARRKTMSSSSPSEKALIGLFPPSLDRILEVNGGFLEAAQALLEQTENAAIKDIELGDSNTAVITSPATSTLADPTGATELSICLLDWFPKFAECYGQYVQAHSQFAQHLRVFMNDTSSSFSKRVQETGEQRLMSMLIEPIQRLPRYSLYISNIIKQLPLRHPALKSLLKAKDLIADICSQDESISQQTKVVERLHTLIPSWPSSFQPKGRLITAMDVTELQAPYDTGQQHNGSHLFILLLFTGHLVWLRRPDESSLSARGLLAEAESLTQILPDQSAAQGVHKTLLFSEWTLLKNIQFTEVQGDKILRTAPSSTVSGPVIKLGLKGETFEKCDIRYFLAGGVFEGKASRWVKELAKARVECRFSEMEREGGKWEARSLDLADNGPDCFAAVLEDGESQEIEGRAEPAATRIVVDQEKGARYVKPGIEGIEIAASVTVVDNGFFRLTVEAEGERPTKDLLTSSEFLPVLGKRISNILQKQDRPRKPHSATCLFQHNLKVLQSLRLWTEQEGQETIRSRTLRPMSPVKMLANLFSVPSTKESTSPTKPGRIAIDATPKVLAPPKANVERKLQASARATLVETNQTKSSAGPLKLLEETFDAYVLALHARKGNVVGRVVQSRAAADEAEVNVLYNTMLEPNDNYEAAAQASVDVLFMAFEKFTQVAWRDTMGPIVSVQDLKLMQAEYGGDMNPILADLAPQNRRALKAIIELLGELLDGASNDGDRGILTAAFTEILVPLSATDANNAALSRERPHDFIPLLDRFVEDYHGVFGESHRTRQASPFDGSINIAGNVRSSKPGSLSSKASSLSRRLGFGSLRDQGKPESPSKGSQLLRNLSKSTRGGESPFSSKSSQTGDADTSPKRPVSRDRPNFLSAFDRSRPGTSGSADISKPLPNVVDKSLNNTPSSNRKKRRSSLSDLRSLPNINDSPMWTTPNFRQLDMAQSRPTSELYAAPQTPSPTKVDPVPILSYSSSIGVASPDQKENTSPSKASVENRPPPSRLSPSGIPRFVLPTTTSMAVPKGVLSERPGSGNTPPPPLSKSSSEVKTPSPKKLRMQSPQKLRERLQIQQKAIADAATSLQAELDSIGQEHFALSLKPPPPYTSTDSDSPIRAEKLALQNLSTRLKAQEAKMSHLIGNLTSQNAAIEKDVAGQLLVSERRARALEDRLALADAESVAVYERMNEELSVVFNECREGRAAEELRRKLVETQDEAVKWKKEALRLKRENMALKAQTGL